MSPPGRTEVAGNNILYSWGTEKAQIYIIKRAKKICSGMELCEDVVLGDKPYTASR
jgi:hypothetical protein